MKVVKKQRKRILISLISIICIVCANSKAIASIHKDNEKNENLNPIKEKKIEKKTENEDCDEKEMITIFNLNASGQIKNAGSNAMPVMPVDTIENIFPDQQLANVIAESLGMNVTDIITISELSTLKSISAGGKGITNLEGLQYLSRSNSEIAIYLYGNSELEDLTPIQSLTNVNDLSLSNTKIGDLTPINSYPVIKKLSIDGTKVTSLDAIKGLGTLETFNLSNTEIDDQELNNLISLSNLKHLYMNYTEISDISMLTSLSELRSIQVNQKDNEKIASGLNINGIENLIKLESFEAKNNQINNLSCFQNLTSLTTLNLSENNITDISTLKNLKNLNTLYLKDNLIDDISGLNDLNKLVRLDLENNQIDDLSPIKNIITLDRLVISKNQISDITMLDALVNLSDFQASENQIRNIDVITNWTNINTLSLPSNQISEIPNLKHNSKLKSLNLMSNEIISIHSLESTTLEYLVLNDNNIDDIDSLNNVPNLKTLLLNNNSILDVKVVKQLDSLLTFQAMSQEIELDEALEYRGELKTLNPIVKEDGTSVAITYMDHDGTYDSLSSQLIWNFEEQSNDEGVYEYHFDCTIVLSSLTRSNCRYSGSIKQPWKQTYTLTFHANGGEGELPQTQDLKANQVSIMPSNMQLKKVGYSFEGWKWDNNGIEEIWDFNSNLMPANDVELYAVWKPAQDTEVKEEEKKLIWKKQEKEKKHEENPRKIPFVQNDKQKSSHINFENLSIQQKEEAANKALVLRKHEQIISEVEMNQSGLFFRKQTDFIGNFLIITVVGILLCEAKVKIKPRKYK